MSFVEQAYTAMLCHRGSAETTRGYLAAAGLTSAAAQASATPRRCSGSASTSTRTARNGASSAGVLLDVARHKGVECLQDGYPITIADLDATAQRAGIAVGRGDFVIIRTGRLEDRLKKND